MQIIKVNRMTNIFQKWFLPKEHWMILDIIDKNAADIKYCAINNDAYKWYTLSLTTKEFLLTASLRKDLHDEKPFSHASYTLHCLNAHQCKYIDCTMHNKKHEIEREAFSYETSQCAKFTFRVYNKMLNHYVKRHGCPMCR